jgi:dolichyl-phosphate beta-glucosyltransferase
MYLSIIIPAYNEEARILSTLESVDAYMRDKKYEYEILVINDGSTDRTNEVVENAATRIPNLRFIDNKNNHGKGWVVRKGMLSAKGTFRLFMDADGSTDISNLDKMLPYAIKEGYDVVAGSRRIEGSEVEMDQSFLRTLLGTIFRTTVRLAVPTGVVDSQNGFKLFTARAAEEIFPRERTFTWAFDVEVLAIARLLKFSIKEVPIRWVNDERSHVTMKGMITMLLEVAEIRMRLWMGAYYTKVADEIRIG